MIVYANLFFLKVFDVIKLSIYNEKKSYILKLIFSQEGFKIAYITYFFTFCINDFDVKLNNFNIIVKNNIFQSLNKE